MKGWVCSFFTKCCDINNDGVVTFNEVLMNTEEAITYLNKTADTLSTYSVLLQAAGIDLGAATQVLNTLSTVLSTTGKGVAALEKISVSIKDGQIGDINGDGKVDREDVKLYFQGALDVTKALAKAGISQSQMNDIQGKLNSMMQLIDKLPNRTYDAGSTAPALR